MKRYFTLLASLFCLICLYASTLQERPSPQWTDGGELKFDESIYMLNVKAGKFLCGGYSFATQACVGDEGWKIRLSKYTENNKEWDEKTIFITDSVVQYQQWKYMFLDDKSLVFMDMESTLHDGSFWTIRKVGNYYRLSSRNPTFSMFNLGIDLTKKDPVLCANLEDNENSQIDWAFLSAEEYEEYQKTIEIYLMAQRLKALIDEAREKGIDTKEQEEIYTNEVATKEDLNAAITSIETAIANWQEQNIGPEDPVNLTFKIVNPSYDNNDNTGWNGTQPLFQTYTNAEHYNKTFDTWQMVENLPNGVYKLTVQGLYRPTNCNEWNYSDGTTPQYAVFYVANGTDSLTIPVPNVYEEISENEVVQTTLKFAAEQFAKGKYYTDVHFNVAEGKVRIGVALPKLAGVSDWVCWDNWQLTYYGNKGEESYNGAVKEMIDANLARFDTITAKISTGIIETYKTTISNLTATDLAGVNNAKQVIEEAIGTVEANIRAWEEYFVLVENGREIVKESNIYCWDKWLRVLDDYIKQEALAFLNRDDMTTQELQEEIEVLENHIRKGTIIGSRVPLVGAVWSYVHFDRTVVDNLGKIKEINAYTRYAVLNKPAHIDRRTYFPLVKYTTCEYEEGQNEAETYRIRMEDNRIYILKEDAPDYETLLLKEEGSDYILYDFNLKVGDEAYKYDFGEGPTPVCITETSTITTNEGTTFNTWKMEGGEWIEGIGSSIDFLNPYIPIRATCDCGTILNYFRVPMNGTEKVYKNPFGNITGVSTTFKENDCVLNPEAIEDFMIQNPHAQFQVFSSTLHCTAPDAVSLEVYTMDAVKVGEAAFVNGEAAVKVGCTPALYLYVVTYPDGHRESGKVLVNEE